MADDQDFYGYEDDEDIVGVESTDQKNDPALRADAPLERGIRGAKRPAILAVAVLVALLGVGFAVVVSRGFFSGGTKGASPSGGSATTEAYAPPMPLASLPPQQSALPFGTKTGAPAMPESPGTPIPQPMQPQPGAAAQSSTAVPCAAGYKSVIPAPGYPPSCVPAAQYAAPGSTVAGGSVQPQATTIVTPPPPPPQEITLAEAPTQTVASSPVAPATRQSVMQPGSAQTVGAATTGEATRNSSRYLPRLTHDQLDAMTPIPFSLVSRVDSDLPGCAIAQTTAPVFDSRSHRYIVIPAGSFGEVCYSSKLVAGQTRLLASVTRLRFPDGREFLFGKPGNVTGPGGASGLAGNIDKHVGQLYGGTALMTLLGAASAALTPATGGGVYSEPTIGQQIASAAGGQLSNLGTKIIGAALQRPPTITLAPPYPFTVVVMHDLALRKYEVRPQVAHLVPVPVAPIPTPTPSGPTQFCCRRLRVRS